MYCVAAYLGPSSWFATREAKECDDGMARKTL